jgi:hypothetical protein
MTPAPQVNQHPFRILGIDWLAKQAVSIGDYCIRSQYHIVLFLV